MVGLAKARPNNSQHTILDVCLLFVTEFAGGSRVLTLMEPMDGSTIPVALTVDRNGGTTGIVSAQWQLIRSDGKHYHYYNILYGGKKTYCIIGLGAISDDIQPTFGLIQFITGTTQRTVTLEIQPDSLPEDNEVNFITG